jgi:L-seryl-tRNA(Ser) seleniumtransferase
MRALRPDKLTIAALLATLETYRDGNAEKELPVWRMIATPPRAIAARARALAAALNAAGIPAEAIEVRSTVGGGSLPEETQPSFAVAIGGEPATRLAQALRSADPPVIARIVDERVALDLRSVLPEDDEVLARAATGALAKGGADGPTRHQNGPRARTGRPV